MTQRRGRQIGLTQHVSSRPIGIILEKTTTKNPKMSEQRDAEPRARLLRTASELFRRHGFQAVGVDMIVYESGVAKMTLYRNFKSKDDLILEYLELENARIWKWLRRVTDHTDNPSEKLLAFFEALGSRTSQDACPGCPFQIVANEFPDHHHPALMLARAHKGGLRDELTRWIRAAGLKDAESTANQLYLLMEGAWAGARMGLEAPPSRNVARAATMVIQGGLYVQAVAGSIDRAKHEH